MKRLLLVLVCAAFAAAVPSARAQIHFTATLDGAQEVPPVTTTASGTGSFVLSDDLTELRYVITYQGLSGTLSIGGHFHFGKAGTNRTVVRDIAVAGGASSATIAGVWRSSDVSQPLTPAVVESLLTGRVYVNFHTTANPGGEIRGQVNLATSLHFEASLDGAQENPPNASTANGTGVFVLNKARTQVDYWITYRGLSGTTSIGGHIHFGAVGRNGGIAKDLAAGGGAASASVKGSWKTTDGTQPLTSAIVDSLIAGKMYSNFHTTANPGGEIRGQLTLKGGIGFVASLEGSKENPPTGSNATATGSFILNGARNQVSYRVTYIGLASPLTAGGHIHVGNSARNGSIVRDLAFGGDSASGTVTGIWKTTDLTRALTTALVESLFTARLYANFHSTAFPGGEIRSQLDLTTGVGFTARLDGTQENPPTGSAASGTGSIVLSPERTDINYSITYFGLSGVLSGIGGHFHTGAAGSNGSVVKNIAAGGSPAAQTLTNTWSSNDVSQALTSAQVDSLIAKKIYANFHTTASPGGEIRGQLLFGFDVVPTSVEQVSAVIPADFRLEQNYPNPFNPSTTIRFQIAKAAQVKLVVYNLLGQEVATLVDELKQAGTYQLPFNAAGLSSGVYFYRLAASGSVIESRKMMLLK